MQKNCSRIVLGMLIAGLAIGSLRAADSGAKVEKKFLDPDAEPWTFEDKGERDPFTFVLVKKEKVKEAEKERTPSGILNQVLLTARMSYKKAEAAFRAYQYKSAVDACDAGLDAFNRDDVRVEDLDSLQEVREQLFRLRLASERLLNRQQAERAFKGLNIRVTGVVAKKRNSVAIVNNQVVARGDLIRGAERGDNAIVDEIIPERVIVRFRGFRMELSVAR